MDPISFALGLMVLVGAFKVGVKATADTYATMKAAGSGKFDFIDADRQRKADTRQKLAAAWAERRKLRAEQAGDDSGTYRPGAKEYAADLYHGFWEDRLDRRGKKRAGRPEWQYDPDGKPWHVRFDEAVIAKGRQLRESRAAKVAADVARRFVAPVGGKGPAAEDVSDPQPLGFTEREAADVTRRVDGQPETDAAAPGSGSMIDRELARRVALSPDEAAVEEAERELFNARQRAQSAYRLRLLGIPAPHNLPAAAASEDDHGHNGQVGDELALQARHWSGLCAFELPVRDGVYDGYCPRPSAGDDTYCAAHRVLVDARAVSGTEAGRVAAAKLRADSKRAWAAGDMAGAVALLDDLQDRYPHEYAEMTATVNDGDRRVELPLAEVHAGLVRACDEFESAADAADGTTEPSMGGPAMTAPTSSAAVAGEVNNNEDARRVFEAQIEAATEASELLAVYEQAQRRLAAVAMSGLDGINGKRFDVQAQAAQANAADLLPAADMSQAAAAIEGIRAAAEAGLAALDKYRDAEGLVNDNNVDGQTLETAGSV